MRNRGLTSAREESIYDLRFAGRFKLLCMADVINLNKARKRRDKQNAEALAAENRVRFGRSKQQKTLEAAQAEEAQRRLDQLKREHDPQEPS
ncbi:MAG: hypothetical protein JWQ90_3254 [Hydrocarboniphaga sp.]|uniref:DUF4169 family protein n=1 Tax=Hydrocarboniphaga sp. TaxID=2033016 RepID=UPI0026121BF6|nr:DUF4169 family protein [Hydrocarboniphaga sp.]MDB5970804.1 hypothetical protein [Hydrocarboniphaga sp.]